MRRGSGWALGTAGGQPIAPDVRSTERTAGDSGTTVRVAAPVPAGVRHGTTVGEK